MKLLSSICCYHFVAGRKSFLVLAARIDSLSPFVLWIVFMLLSVSEAVNNLAYFSRCSFLLLLSFDVLVPCFYLPSVQLFVYSCYDCQFIQVFGCKY